MTHWEELNCTNTDSMEDYIWSRDYIDVIRDSDVTPKIPELATN